MIKVLRLARSLRVSDGAGGNKGGEEDKRKSADLRAQLFSTSSAERDEREGQRPEHASRREENSEDEDENSILL